MSSVASSTPSLLTWKRAMSSSTLTDLNTSFDDELINIDLEEGDELAAALLVAPVRQPHNAHWQTPPPPLRPSASAPLAFGSLVAVREASPSRT